MNDGSPPRRWRVPISGPAHLNFGKSAASRVRGCGMSLNGGMFFMMPSVVLRLGLSGMLERAPSAEVRQSIIDGRIRHLQREIQAFQDQIDKLLGGGL